jgi:hypothetical protein
LIYAEINFIKELSFKTGVEDKYSPLCMPFVKDLGAPALLNLLREFRKTIPLRRGIIILDDDARAGFLTFMTGAVLITPGLEGIEPGSPVWE